MRAYRRSQRNQWRQDSDPIQFFESEYEQRNDPSFIEAQRSYDSQQDEFDSSQWAEFGASGDWDPFCEEDDCL